MAEWRAESREVLRRKDLQLDASVDRLEAGGQVELSVAHLQSECQVVSSRMTVKNHNFI